MSAGNGLGSLYAEDTLTDRFVTFDDALVNHFILLQHHAEPEAVDLLMEVK